MRIVHLHRRIRLEDGGTVRSAIDLCAMMAARGHEVRLLTFDDAHAPAAWRQGSSGVPTIERLPSPALPGGFLSPWQRRALARRLEDAEVVHLHGVWVPSTAQAAAVCQRLRVPYVLTLHGMLDDWSMRQSALRKRLYMRWRGRRMFERAAAIHATSQAELRQATPWLARSNGVVIPLPVDLAGLGELPGPTEARRTLGLPDDGVPIIAFVGRVHPQKRIETLIDAVSALRRRGIAAHLVIAGPGDEIYLSALRHRAAAAGIADSTHMPGLVDGTVKAATYVAAEVLALPSEQESFGLVIVEALACGTAAICTRGIDFWRELQSSGGVVIAGPDANAFADAIAGLLEDADRRCAMADAGRRWVMQTLDPARVSSEYEALYRRATAAAYPAVATRR